MLGCGGQLYGPVREGCSETRQTRVCANRQGPRVCPAAAIVTAESGTLTRITSSGEHRLRVERHAQEGWIRTPRRAQFAPMRDRECSAAPVINSCLSVMYEDEKARRTSRTKQRVYLPILPLVRLCLPRCRGASGRRSAVRATGRRCSRLRLRLVVRPIVLREEVVVARIRVQSGRLVVVMVDVAVSSRWAIARAGRSLHRVQQPADALRRIESPLVLSPVVRVLAQCCGLPTGLCGVPDSRSADEWHNGEREGDAHPLTLCTRFGSANFSTLGWMMVSFTAFEAPSTAEENIDHPFPRAATGLS